MNKGTCQFCGDVFKVLKQHIKNTKCGGEVSIKSFTCTHCYKTFKIKAALNVHIKRIHKQIKDRKCPHCSYATYNGYNLRLVDALHFAEDVDNLQIVATFNLKEIFHNLDNLQLDNNYYDDEEGVAKDILLMLTGDYDVHPVTRLMSIIFPLNETTRK